MPTRKQEPENKRFCQNAFASSSEYDRGILANLVATRCHKLIDAEEIAMLWWLQQISWREGSLEKFASEFLAANACSVGTPTMRAGTSRSAAPAAPAGVPTRSRTAPS